jgi:REP element-mobilizing transposase RayT
MAESGEIHPYPRRLHHEIPFWVKSGASFHIRFRATSTNRVVLTDKSIASSLLNAAHDCHRRTRWYCHLLLLMPDHAHALLAFPRDEWMSRVIGEWKAYAARTFGVCWQTNYSDRRMRNGKGFSETVEHIRSNPVTKGLCLKPEDWPWSWSPVNWGTGTGGTCWPSRLQPAVPAGATGRPAA